MNYEILQVEVLKKFDFLRGKINMCNQNVSCSPYRCEKIVYSFLTSYDWQGLTCWLNSNPDGCEILITILTESSNSQPIPDDFVSNVLARLPKQTLQLTSELREIIEKTNNQLDWGLLLVYIATAKILKGHNEFEQAVMKLWSAVSVIYAADQDEIPYMLKYLLLTCKSLPVFQDTAPLLLGIAAVQADRARDSNKRNQLIDSALQMSPYDEELLALVERRSWSNSKKISNEVPFLYR